MLVIREKQTTPGELSPLAAAMALSGKAVDGMQQVADLNLGMLKATLQQTNYATRQLASARNAQQFLSLVAAQIEPSAMRTLDYGYYLTAIASDTQVEFINVIGARIADMNRRLIGMAEDASRIAATGMRATVGLLWSLVGHGRPGSVVHR